MERFRLSHQPPLNDRLQDFHAGEAVTLLVEVVEVVAVGETLLQVVVVAEQLVVGGEGEMQQRAVAFELVEDLPLEVGELSQVGGGELVLLLRDVVLLLAEVFRQCFRRTDGGVDDDRRQLVLHGAVDGEKAAQRRAHHQVHALHTHHRVELLLHIGGALVVERGRQYLVFREHLLDFHRLVSAAGGVETVNIKDFLGHTIGVLGRESTQNLNTRDGEFAFRSNNIKMIFLYFCRVKSRLNNLGRWQKR